MAFDGVTTTGLVQELQAKLVGGRITKIIQPEKDELLFTIKSTLGQYRLFLSASAALPLAYLTEENKPAPQTAPAFCMLLRKHIGGGHIVAISQPGLERIFSISIEHTNELGDPCQKELIVELMGKHSNLIFCDEEKNILDSIKHVPGHISSLREVLPGRTYFIPNPQEKQHPLTVGKVDFLQRLSEGSLPLAKAIYTRFTGISPLLAEEICYRAKIDSSLTEKDLDGSQQTCLYEHFQNAMEAIKKAAFTPTIYYENGKPTEFSLLPLTVFSDLQKETYPSVSEMLFSFYASKNTFQRIQQKSSDLRHIVQLALERTCKKYDLQKRQLADTQDREKYKVYGELLHTYGYQLAPKATELTTVNYYTNEPVTVPLDPAKTATENAARYFEKYNKKKRTFEALSTLLVETEAEIDYLSSVQNALQIASNEGDLADIQEELTKTGYLRRKPSKKKISEKSKPLHYLSSDGFHLYVGKNNLQNDALTFHFATGSDWWFHAKKAPGSHVILRTNGQTPPDRAFEEAGRLAAHYSSMRNADKVEVDYVEKKHVKKPSGGKPGFVVYYTNYSMMVGSDLQGLTLMP